MSDKVRSINGHVRNQIEQGLKANVQFRIAPVNGMVRFEMSQPISYAEMDVELGRKVAAEFIKCCDFIEAQQKAAGP